MICAYCKRAEATGGPGPIDACGGCKLDMYFIGRLTSELNAKAAHIIMGAFACTESEGVHCVASEFKDCYDVYDHEVQVIRLLFKIHPDVVRDPEYSHLGSVKEVLQ